MEIERFGRLQQLLRESGSAGVALVPGPNMVYMSGMHSHVSERPFLLFLPADKPPAVVIPLLEAPKAVAAGIEQIFSWRDADGYDDAFAAACAALNVGSGSWAVEALHMRVLELELLHRHAPGLQTTHAESLIGELRIIKDSQEIAAMRQAAVIAEEALKQLLPQIKIGITEREIAQILMSELQKAGSEGNPFGPIVSAGPNGSSPHAVPTDRPIEAGDLLILDWGAIVDGYPSDITRTFAVGEIDPELQQIYALVKGANAAGVAATAPGVSCGAIDAAARSVIEAGGYGQYFIHRTGHGLGVEIHEPPYMMQNSEVPLRSGMLFTVEPGIYLPGKGGVRIEDDIVVTATGYECITSYPRTLQRVG